MKSMKTMKKMAVVLLAGIMTVSFAACGKSSNQTSTETQGSTQPQGSTETQGTPQTQNAEAFPKFQGKDFDGNDVDNSLFSKNEATLLNFWFNGCSACVNEMPDLEKFNAKMKEKGAELLGVNVELGDNEAALKEAKEIMAKQGATYRNLVIDSNQEARSYMSKIFSFPTSVLIDKNGNIVGQPIVGVIDEKRMEEILKVIDELKAGKDVSSSISSDEAPSANDPVNKLLEEENKIFTEHNDVWQKVFAKIQKDKVQQNENMPYAEFLKSQIEQAKDSFTEDELKTLDEDMKKIEEIEAKIMQMSQPK